MKLGYTLFYVDDVEKSVEFYNKAFGLEIGFVHDSKQYAELVTGPTKIGFVDHKTAGSHGFTYNKMSVKSPPPAFEIGLISDNVEESYQKAVKAGAISVSEPKQKPWGQVVSYVRDCNGFLVEICSAM